VEKMDKDKVVGCLYLKFNSLEGPNPVLTIPENLSEEILTKVSKIVIEHLSQKQSKKSKSLEMLEFPSLNLNGFVKYKQWEDTLNPKGYTRTSLILLFEDKHLENFQDNKEGIEHLFDEYLFDIIGLEHKSAERKKYIKLLKKFRKKIIKI
jgi:hypothetical protein